MGIPFLILLAVIWALFGLWCFLHGAKFALLLTALIAGVLLALSAFPEQVAQYFGYINAAAEMFGGGKKTQIGAKPADQILILLFGVMILAALLGFLKTFRGRHSIAAFFLGLLDGYIFTAYLATALLPNLAFLPLPIKILGLAPVQLSAALTTPSSQGFLAQVNKGLENATKLGCSSEAVIVLIVGFILLVIFAGGRGGKKG